MGLRVVRRSPAPRRDGGWADRGRPWRRANRRGLLRCTAALSAHRSSRRVARRALPCAASSGASLRRRRLGAAGEAGPGATGGATAGRAGFESWTGARLPRGASGGARRGSGARGRARGGAWRACLEGRRSATPWRLRCSAPRARRGRWRRGRRRVDSGATSGAPVLRRGRRRPRRVRRRALRHEGLRDRGRRRGTRRPLPAADAAPHEELLRGSVRAKRLDSVLQELQEVAGPLGFPRVAGAAAIGMKIQQRLAPRLDQEPGPRTVPLLRAQLLQRVERGDAKDLPVQLRRVVRQPTERVPVHRPWRAPGSIFGGIGWRRAAAQVEVVLGRALGRLNANGSPISGKEMPARKQPVSADDWLAPGRGEAAVGGASPSVAEALLWDAFVRGEGDPRVGAEGGAVRRRATRRSLGLGLSAGARRGRHGRPLREGPPRGGCAAGASKLERLPRSAARPSQGRRRDSRRNAPRRGGGALPAGCARFRHRGGREAAAGPRRGAGRRRLWPARGRGEREGPSRRARDEKPDQSPPLRVGSLLRRKVAPVSQKLQVFARGTRPRVQEWGEWTS
jgi:hypothetical protein